MKKDTAKKGNQELVSELPKEKQLMLTEKELENLQKVVFRGQTLKSEFGLRTLEKEERIRQINVEYDILYTRFEDELRFLEKTQKQVVSELHQKYGNDVLFDINSGNIKKQ